LNSGGAQAPPLPFGDAMPQPAEDDDLDMLDQWGRDPLPSDSDASRIRAALDLIGWPQGEAAARWHIDNRNFRKVCSGAYPAPPGFVDWLETMAKALAAAKSNTRRKSILHKLQTSPWPEDWQRPTGAGRNVRADLDRPG
jgi:hypothetical protein